MFYINFGHRINLVGFHCLLTNTNKSKRTKTSMYVVFSLEQIPKIMWTTRKQPWMHYLKRILWLHLYWVLLSPLPKCVHKIIRNRSEIGLRGPRAEISIFFRAYVSPRSLTTKARKQQLRSFLLNIPMERSPVICDPFKWPAVLPYHRSLGHASVLQSPFLCHPFFDFPLTFEGKRCHNT